MNCLGQEAIHISKSTGEINFDGVVDDSAWKISPDFPLTMHFPVFNNVPEEKSNVYITFDDNFFWVGAVLYYDNIANIVSTSKKRDEESVNSDAFGIIIDSYNDNENALGFFTMPTGLKIDYTISNDGQSDGLKMDSRNYTWNTFWDVKTITTDTALACGNAHPFFQPSFSKKE